MSFLASIFFAFMGVTAILGTFIVDHVRPPLAGPQVPERKARPIDRILLFLIGGAMISGSIHEWLGRW